MPLHEETNSGEGSSIGAASLIASVAIRKLVSRLGSGWAWLGPPRGKQVLTYLRRAVVPGASRRRETATAFLNRGTRATALAARSPTRLSLRPGAGSRRAAWLHARARGVVTRPRSCEVNTPPLSRVITREKGGQSGRELRRQLERCRWAPARWGTRAPARATSRAYATRPTAPRITKAHPAYAGWASRYAPMLQLDTSDLQVVRNLAEQA